MSWAGVFAATNAVALAGWLALLLLPRGPKVMALVLYLGVGLLCFIYAAAFVALFGGLADPVRLAGAAPPDLTNYSIPSLRAMFMSDGGMVIGWTHYLAFDLFVGQWIAKDADHKRFSRLAQVPVLLATFLAGPIGLFVWLVVRERRARANG
jgi:hypothetical protein